MAEEKEQTFEFQSEVKQLLDILVYSLYKNKEVFLRELVSNAADALNKMQFEFLTVPDLEGRDQELKITIAVDKKHNKLVIEDNGMGMTREELVQNIGTIAHSGTLDYLKTAAAEPGRRPGGPDRQVRRRLLFQLHGGQGDPHHQHAPGRRTARPGCGNPRAKAAIPSRKPKKKTRGTRIELLLKKDEKEFLEDYRLKNIILKHSKFVPFPITWTGKRSSAGTPSGPSPSPSWPKRTMPTSTSSSKTPRRSRRPGCTSPPTPRCSSTRCCTFPRPRSSCWG